MFTYAGQFAGARMYAFDKSDLYAGNPVTAVTSGVGSGLFTPQPLNLHGQSTGTWPAFGDSQYVLLGQGSASTVLYEWNIATNVTTTVGTTTLGPAAFSPVDVPQLAGDSLDGGSTRIQDFEYRNGYGWTTQTISCNPGAGTVNCIRWAQIDLTNASLGPAGAGSFGSTTEYRTYGDLAVNHCDDMMVGYTKSSPNIYPSIYATGRQSGDAAGTVQPEIRLKSGEVAYTSFEGSAPRRWGDYTGMTVDPDGMRFWYLGEYSKDRGGSSTRWGTYISELTFGDCTSSATFNLIPEPNERLSCQGSDVTYNIELTGLNGFGGLIGLSAISQPGTATFSPNPISLQPTQMLTVPTNVVHTAVLTISNAAAGNYAFQVVGEAITTTAQVTRTLFLDVDAGLPSAPTLNSPAKWGHGG